MVLLRDPKDDHYLSLCKEVGADSLITGDKDLLTISPKALQEKGMSCRIFTPRRLSTAFRYDLGKNNFASFSRLDDLVDNLTF